MTLSEARAALARVIDAGRPKRVRYLHLCPNGARRYTTGLEAPRLSPERKKELDDQAAELGAIIARLERERGTLAPRLAPKVPQIPPSKRPDRQANTPKVGKWGFGRTPLYRGRKFAPADKGGALASSWVPEREVTELPKQPEAAVLRPFDYSKTTVRGGKGNVIKKWRKPKKNRH